MENLSFRGYAESTDWTRFCCHNLCEKLSDIRGEVKDIGWGNQIRSYVLQPYTMVKDHRTDVESGNVDAVLDGSLDTFINGYLKWISVSGK